MTRRHRVLATVLAGLLLLGAGQAVAADRFAVPAGDGEVLTLLLLGSDEGPPRSADPMQGRADAFQLLFVSGDRQHATFVSVPRDAWVPVAGRGNGRINSCLVGGAQRCADTVEQVFGIQVDGWFVTTMDAFKAGVQAFGGIEVDVAVPVSDGGSAITQTGVQTLSGSQALTYGRDRKRRPGGDFARSAAQAEMLALAHEQLLERPSPNRVLRAATILRRHTVTSLSGPEVARLAFEAVQLPPGNVQRVTAPGDDAMVGPAAVVRLRQSAYDIIRDAADDARVTG